MYRELSLQLALRFQVLLLLCILPLTPHPRIFSSLNIVAPYVFLIFKTGLLHIPIITILLLLLIMLPTFFSCSGLAVGDRVLANASSWFSKNMDHGAFQQYVIVPTAAVTKLPDSIPLDEAAMLPLAVYTAWYGMLVNGIPRDTKYQLSDNKGILIWGVGGSVGSVTLQVIKSMRAWTDVVSYSFYCSIMSSD